MLRALVIRLLRLALSRLTNLAEDEAAYRQRLAVLERERDEAREEAERHAREANVRDGEFREYRALADVEAEKLRQRVGVIEKERDDARLGLSWALAEIADLRGDDLGRRLALESAGLAATDGGGH